MQQIDAGDVAIKLAVHKLVARENLRRAEAGEEPLTQQEIANGSGVSQAVISTILRRKATRLDLKTINGLCNFFRVEPSGLFDYEPD
jgi:transcriptional regulator with XRE-family HTH domain